MEATNNEQKTPSEYRLSILKKMEEYERLGLFDQDLEEDPPSKLQALTAPYSIRMSIQSA